MSYKLFIPGPIAVSEKTLRAMSQPMIGHRSTDFVALYNSIQPDLQALFYTKDGVYLSTSSAFGSMEGAIRNVVKKKVLSCMNGAFADKWNDVALRCGKQATALKFDWGQPVDPEAVRRELATGAYDAITVIHNETSCGCMSDLAAIMQVVREFPDVISIVDTVSSFSALPIKKDELGIDVFITGSQKALALPPTASPATQQLATSVKESLADCLERDESGRPKLTITLPNTEALDQLATALASLLAHRQE